MAFLIVSLLLAVFGMVVGFHFGDELGARAKTSRDFWKTNALCYGAVIVATAVFVGLELAAFIFLCVGFLGGFIAGMRKGYNKPLGFWKLHEKFYHAPKRERKKRKKATKAGDTAETTAGNAREKGQHDTH